ncbi:MAG: [acyl-carrier-protein] S-malonyltransferase [Candidatus Infernicultor aquiphilus]|uniref:Malonyl CoA-acyl carrier protein transacylase n=1 Tax=Candidatus Infernicultor aquiphilus TaxID=1805029 RepID=A0A1J5GCM7_9BACT|nr:ACP S-malonyltransferase [bacterium]OIP70493.1 MAG: [acyl-carrier-protein] S-malonyltransferase [Candidatus Atribacteria bacterium CG2_30_33_13]PIU25359.1 MAG: [acyl-carrier-protein] S-malonyltransferase [Candidatus Atribacteria bacterium CG08_land_8_20_14_0_20_33_29]PIW11612.1 MAG: [acyl-carrier-protein] S-malonyltransferase [Candidatus Atribacteria bacterium CG17_big_fil_post_rev_8_21_14_2_50_34_11]PIX34753.1 MAG: [acyl-carrier-protein] S-malonyltransferase [Candidatus Atribacteria bacteri
MEKIAFVFPGQGSQKVGMGKDLIENYEEAKIFFKEANLALKEEEVNISKLCFEGPEEELKNTINAQPAILTVSTILFELLKKYDIKPSVVAGHSLGEYTALVANRSIKFKEAVKLVRKRGEYMQSATPIGTGSMLAILGLKEEEISKLFKEISNLGIVEITNYNSPTQIVVSGEIKPLEKLSLLVKQKGAKAIPLKVSAPFHSSLMKLAKVNLAKYLERIDIQNPQIPIICNVNAEYARKKEEIKLSLIEQMDHPVRWVDSIKKMNSEGINYFIEVGPGKVLKELIKQIIPEAKIFNVFDSNSLKNVVEKMKEVI